MSAPLDIDQLHTFIAIIDSGSFTKAADRVFKTQSAVLLKSLAEASGAGLVARKQFSDRALKEFEKAGKTSPESEGFFSKVKEMFGGD